MNERLTDPCRRYADPVRTIGARLAAWALGASLVLVACGGGSATAPAGSGPAGPGTCGGEVRPQLDCSTEFKYDAVNGQGSLHVASFVNLSGSVEQKALREIDQQTALFIAEAHRLCDEYNKCVVDKDTYATRSENLRRRLAQVPELLDGVKSASGDDAQRAALATAYREIVPDGGRTELRISFSVVARRPNEQMLVPIAKDAPLPSGSHVAFGIEPSRDAYVYLFQKSASGAVNVLFPDPRIAARNPIPAGATLQIPQGGASFKLDDKDLGAERVYIVASLRPVTALAAAAEKASQGGQPGEAIQQVTAIDGTCKTRGLTLDDSAPAPSGSCARTRGLSLADDSSAGRASMVATTEAADDTIATVFSFQHTR